MTNAHIRMGAINSRAIYFKIYPFTDAFPNFRKTLCFLSFLDSNQRFIFLNQILVGNMPQKFGFDANNEIIPNQTILREKNQ